MKFYNNLIELLTERSSSRSRGRSDVTQTIQTGSSGPLNTTSASRTVRRVNNRPVSISTTNKVVRKSPKGGALSMLGGAVASEIARKAALGGYIVGNRPATLQQVIGSGGSSSGRGRLDFDTFVRNLSTRSYYP